jgi:hypothetical protein
MAAMAVLFEHVADRGILAIDDPAVAASQFNWLIMGEPLNRAMLLGGDIRQGSLITAERAFRRREATLLASSLKAVAVIHSAMARSLAAAPTFVSW